MAERSDIFVRWNEDPRIVVVGKSLGSKELTAQDYVDTARGVLEKSWNGIDEPYLIDGSGKQNLGGDVKVGITVESKNAVIQFEERTTSISSGTATTADDAGTKLIDNTADFVTDGVKPGDCIINFTDKSVCSVIRVVNLTELLCTNLADGTENDWDIGDVYKIWETVECSLSGGNFTAVDKLGDPIALPVIGAPFVSYARTAASSATLQELLDIQYASFNDGVTIDVVNGVSGTTYNIGTSQKPSNNLADAKTIAAERGFNKFYIVGNFTFGGKDNIDEFQIEGQNCYLTTVTITNGCSTIGTEFRDCTITGTLTGEVEIIYSILDNLSGFYGRADNCCLKGIITLDGTSSDMANFMDCKLGTILVGLVEINMNGDAAGLVMRPYTGGVKVSNKTGSSKVAIDFLSGRIELEDSITAGTFFIRGTAEITKNNATGITLHSDPLINPAVVSDAVWDEDRLEHVLSGSFGEAAGAVFTDVELLKKLRTGIWEIVDNQMIYYDPADGVTPILTCNLFNKAGQPAEDDVYKREPV